MFEMDWYVWPICTLLGVTLIGMGTKKALTPEKEAHFRYRWVTTVPVSYIRTIGWFELGTAILYLTPAIVSRNEISFIALVGTIPALILAILNFRLCMTNRRFPHVFLPTVVAMASITLAIMLIL